VKTERKKKVFVYKVSPEITQNVKKKEKFKNKPVGKGVKWEYKKTRDKNDMDNAVAMDQSRFRINKI
jgi:hypothetical protein